MDREVDGAQSGDEIPCDPAQPIIDAHHHLYDRPGHRYLAEDFRADLATGHNVFATVFVQARGMYRKAGAVELRPVGETEFAAAQGGCAAADTAVPGLCAGIVAFADLTLGAAVEPVLLAHHEAGRGRLRGIRMPLAWDADRTLLNPAYPTAPELMMDSCFQAGFSRLAPLGLSFDAWLFFHQLPALTRLARSYPDTQIVVDHCGGVLGSGVYRGKHDEVFAAWSIALRELALCANVSIKLSGLGMKLSDFDYRCGSAPPTSAALAARWQPWMERCIEYFGADRCMFASNFPVDRACHSYSTGWNAMQRLCAALPQHERDALFWKTAARVYRLNAVQDVRGERTVQHASGVPRIP